jgi:DNA-binding XRE family transcriptional regulator
MEGKIKHHPSNKSWIMNNTNMNEIKELKAFLKGKTITEASKILKVSRQTIYNWLNGRHSFNLKNWKKISSL